MVASCDSARAGDHAGSRLSRGYDEILSIKDGSAEPDHGE